MKPSLFLYRTLTLFLTFTLTAPNPALALRQTGLEESDSPDDPNSAKKQLLAALTGLPPAPSLVTGSATTRSGLEEPISVLGLRGRVNDRFRWFRIETVSELAAIPRNYLEAILRHPSSGSRILGRRNQEDIARIDEGLRQRGLQIPLDPSSAPAENIESLGLPVRIWSRLRRHERIKTVAQLTSCTITEVAAVWNLRALSLQEVQTALAHRGLHFFPAGDLVSLQLERVSSQDKMLHAGRIAPYLQNRILSGRMMGEVDVFPHLTELDAAQTLTRLIAYGIYPLFIRSTADRYPFAVSLGESNAQRTAWEVAELYVRSQPYPNHAEFLRRIHDPAEATHFMVEIMELAENVLAKSNLPRFVTVGLEEKETVAEQAGTLMERFRPFKGTVFPVGAEMDRLVVTIVDTTTDENGKPSPERAALLPYLPAGTIAIGRSFEDLKAAEALADRTSGARVIYLDLMPGKTEAEKFQVAMRLAVSGLVPGLGVQILSGRTREEIGPALGNFQGRVEYVAPATWRRMLKALKAGPELIALFESGIFKSAQDNWAALAEYL